MRACATMCGRPLSLVGTKRGLNGLDAVVDLSHSADHGVPLGTRADRALFEHR
jgi:hypothetical protein